MQQAVESVISVINDFFWSNLLIILLVSIGIYFTIRSRFLQFHVERNGPCFERRTERLKVEESLRFKLFA